MRTIPDTVDLIKKKLRPFRPIAILDRYYSILEHVGVKLSSFAWHKRWCNRKDGTGYKK